MNKNANHKSIDTLGKTLADAALRLLVRLYPAVRQANDAQLEAACAAMRGAARAAVDEFLTDAHAAPTMAQVAFHSAVLSIAHAGIQSLQAA